MNLAQAPRWPSHSLSRARGAVGVSLLTFRIACRLAAIAAAASLLLAAVVLCLRRLAGALLDPLDAAELAAVAVAAGTCQFAARLLWTRATPGRPLGVADWGFQAALSTGLLAVGLAASLPGSTPRGLLFLWLLAVLTEAVGWALIARPRALGVGGGAKIGRGLSVGSTTSARPGEDIAQQVTRREKVDGSEVVQGCLSTRLQAGQRHAFAHVAFCPPLAGTPEVSARQVSGPSARIKTGQVLPYGARFDIKLDEAARGPDCVRLEFTAVCPRPK